MSFHTGSLQILTCAIFLLISWASKHHTVYAWCPPHQTMYSPLQTCSHAITRHRSQYRPLCGAITDDSDRARLCTETADKIPPNRLQSMPMKRNSFLHTLSRTLLTTTSVATVLSYPTLQAHAAASTKDKPTLSTSLAMVTEARTQLDPIPSLIKSEKWDSIRAILNTPPLCDCWMKTARPLLQDYAKALGDNPTLAIDDDAEFSALGFKEEALDHLRFLDMSAYNNVFNPIKAEGESGASKELVKSYYEDPVREYKASVEAIEGLIKLVKSS